MLLRVDNLYTTLAVRVPSERRWLSRYLQFDDPQARFRSASLRDKHERMFDAMSERFPTGFLSLVVAAAKREGYTCEVLDTRAKPCEPDLEADLGWLRPYQREAVATVLAGKPRGLWHMPTASGKTEAAVGIVLSVPCRWGLLVHRAGLAQQAADRYLLRTGEQAGFIGEGQWKEHGERFVCCTFQSLHAGLLKGDKRVLALLNSFEGIIADECFPAGTMIGSLPIEQLREGALVPSYDEATERHVARRVARRWARKPSALVRLHFSGGGALVCTPGHPLLTAAGWLPAYSLCGESVLACQHDDQKDPLRSLRTTAGPNNDPRQSERFLRPMQGSSPDRACEGANSALRNVREGAASIWTPGAGARPAGAHLLLEGMPRGGPVGELHQNGDQVCCAGQRPYARAQSGLDAGCEGTRCQLETGKRRSVPDEARRQRAPSPGTAATTVGAAKRCAWRLGDGVHCAHQDEVWASGWSEDRHRARRAQDCCGSGRAQPQGASAQGTGCSKERVPQWRRVDRVEVLESGSDGRFGGLCPDGLVYNLEVEGTHTYLVGEGFVAHNCHTVPAATYWRVAMATPSAYWRIGMSGTPLARGDHKGVLAIASLGPVIYRIRADVLIEAGALARPRIRMVPLNQPCDLPTWQGVYGKCIARSAKRNDLLARICKRAEKPCLLFVKELRHGREMVRRLGAEGLRAEFTSGTHSSEWRRNLIKALEGDRLDVLVSSVVMQEGVDIPTLASVVVGSGGRSVIATLQRLGRGARTDQGRKLEFALYDVKDGGNRWLVRHTRERLKAYLSENFEVTEVTM